MSDAGEQFVSEPIEPEAGSFDAGAMARGEAGLPARFRWRGTAYGVARLVASWKSSKADRGEMYLKRHWFTVVTDSGHTMTLYCDRQARKARRPKRRWWLYRPPSGPAGGA